MDEKITADWARSQMKESPTITNQLDKCEVSIRGAIERNEAYCYVPICADDVVVQELKYRGFTCEISYGERDVDETYLIIRW